MGYNYYDYQNWDFYPILAISIVFAFGYPILLSFLHCYKEETAVYVMYLISKITFRDAFKRTTSEKDEKVYYSMLGYRCSKKLLLVNSLMSIAIWQAAFATFWAVFLIEESFACDENLDCFPVRSNSSHTLGLLIQDVPIKDCSKFILADDIQVLCFRYSLNYAEALGAAGGVFLIATTFIRGHLEVLMEILRIEISKYMSHQENIKLWKLIIAMFLYAVCGLILLLLGSIILLATCASNFLFSIFFRSHASIMQYCSYLYALPFSSIGAMYSAYYIVEKGSNKENQPLVVNSKR